MAIILSPLQRRTDDETFPTWHVPNALGSVFDLRNEFQRRNPGRGLLAPGWALAVVPSGLVHPDSIVIGDDFDSPVNDALKNTIRRELNLGETIAASTPLAISAELMIHHGDPVGVNRWAMPSATQGAFTCYLGGVRIAQRRFDINDVNDSRHSAILRRERADYRKARELSLLGTHPPDFHRRYLTYLMEFYQTDNHELFIDSDLPNEKPLPRRTEIRDTFFQAGDITLSSHTPTPTNWGPWQEVNNIGGNINVIAATDVIEETNGIIATYRANSSLDGKAQSCDMDLTGGSGGTRRRMGVITRYKETGTAASDNDHYLALWNHDDTDLELFRVDNSSPTLLATMSKAIIGTQNLELESDGNDNHRVFVDDTLELGPSTDATYTALRCGVRARDNGATEATGDNWRAQDLVAPPPVSGKNLPPYGQVIFNSADQANRPRYGQRIARGTEE